jgi:hypothetical protein
MIQSDKPIALFDTERSFKALLPLFEENQIEAVHQEDQRSLQSVHDAMKWCEAGGADILIIDSITHIWETYVENYKKSKKRDSLQMQDWGIIKPQWKALFSDTFVRSSVHIIFTGRAGYTYADEKDENGKRQIFKDGIKMKAEGETAFEPDILVMMERLEDLLSEPKKVSRLATVLKDRTTLTDGLTCENPDFDFFYPAIKVLLNGKLKKTYSDEIPDNFKEFESRFDKIRQRIEVAVAEVKGSLKLIGLNGTGKMETQTSTWLINQIWGVNSIEKVETLAVDKVEAGEKIMKQFAQEYSQHLATCVEEQRQPTGDELKAILAKYKAK